MSNVAAATGDMASATYARSFDAIAERIADDEKAAVVPSAGCATKQRFKGSSFPASSSPARGTTHTPSPTRPLHRLHRFA